MSVDSLREVNLVVWSIITLAAMAKKLGVNFFHYIHDRVADLYALPSLVGLIYLRPPAASPAAIV